MFTDPCDSSPCKNRGSCIFPIEDAEGGWKCYCEDGWRGDTCSESDSKFSYAVKYPKYEDVIVLPVDIMCKVISIICCKQLNVISDLAKNKGSCISSSEGDWT